MSHHVYFIGHPCLRAVMVGAGQFQVESRTNWQSTDWILIAEPAASLDEIERQVMGGHYALFED